MNTRKANIFLSLVVITLCFVTAELYFKFFFIQSDGFGITIAGNKWIKKYWKPINSFGYRDREWTANDLLNKKVIAVLGDSFVAGHGIKELSSRFPEVLARHVGNDYAVINISQCGWDTQSEIIALEEFPYKVDTVILSYYPNDIHEAAYGLGKKCPYADMQPKGLLGEIVSKSHFINFVYWRFARSGINSQLKTNYNWRYDQYNDPEVWNAHKSELESLYRLTKSKGANLIVVTFPFLTSPKKSIFITNKVTEVFKKLDVPVLNVEDVISNMAKKDIVINNVDAHPSKNLHKKIGDELFNRFFKLS